MSSVLTSCPVGDPPTYYPIILAIPNSPIPNQAAALALVNSRGYIPACELSTCNGQVIVADPTVGHGNPTALPYNTLSPSSVIYDEEMKVPTDDRFWSALPAPGKPGYFILRPKRSSGALSIQYMSYNNVYIFVIGGGSLSGTGIVFRTEPASLPGYNKLLATVSHVGSGHPAIIDVVVKVKTERHGLWELQLGGDGAEGMFRFLDPAPGGTLADKKFVLCTTNCPSNFTSECAAYFNNLIDLSKVPGTEGDKYYKAAVPVLKDYCAGNQGDNLTTPQCAKFCNASQACNTALEDYCKQHQNDTKTCPCYLPKGAYETYLNKLITDIPANQRNAVASYIGQDFSKPSCFYPPCQVGAEIRPDGICPSTSISFCIQNTKINPGTVGGGIKAVSQCLIEQNNKNVSTPKTPVDGVPETPVKTLAKSSISLYILIGGGVLVLIIIIILIVVATRK